MKKTEIFFPFEPKPKGRPRFTRSGHAYTPTATHEYEKLIKEHYQQSTDDFYNGAIHIRLTFMMSIPKSTSKKMRSQIEDGQVKYIKKPDIDNMQKAILDALNGIAFEDDKLITRIVAEKKYTTSEAGTFMVITEDVE